MGDKFDVEIEKSIELFYFTNDVWMLSIVDGLNFVVGYFMLFLVTIVKLRKFIVFVFQKYLLGLRYKCAFSIVSRVFVLCFLCFVFELEKIMMFLR